MLLAMLLLLWTDIPIESALKDSFASFIKISTSASQWRSLYRVVFCFWRSIIAEHTVILNYCLMFRLNLSIWILKECWFDSTTFVSDCEIISNFWVLIHQDSGPFTWIEFFAGEAQATQMFQYSGHDTARLDILYMTSSDGKQNPMNLCSDAGMGWLGGTEPLLSVLVWRCTKLTKPSTPTKLSRRVTMGHLMIFIYNIVS